MSRTSRVSGFILLVVWGAGASCNRIATEPVPEWIFQTYSDRLVGAYDGVTLTRYTFHEDHRVTAEAISSCGASLTEYAFTWEALDGNELALYPAEDSPTIPESEILSHWVVGYGDPCEPLQFDGVLAADGQRTARGMLYVGALCAETVPPPDDWPGGEWSECELLYCEGSSSTCE